MKICGGVLGRKKKGGKENHEKNASRFSNKQVYQGWNDYFGRGTANMKNGQEKSFLSKKLKLIIPYILVEIKIF